MGYLEIFGNNKLAISDKLFNNKNVKFVSIFHKTDAAWSNRPETDGEITVVLDTELTPELIEEGILREIVSKIQTMRKEAGFEVTDHIKVGYSADGLAKKVLDDKAYLKDVLGESADGNLSGYVKEWDVNGNKVTLAVEKV